MTFLSFSSPFSLAFDRRVQPALDAAAIDDTLRKFVGTGLVNVKIVAPSSVASVAVSLNGVSFLAEEIAT